MPDLLEMALKKKQQLEKKLGTPTKPTQIASISNEKVSKVKTHPQKKHTGNSNSRNSIPKKFSKTLDLDRGIYRLLTNIGDKDMSKAELEAEIKVKLTDPNALATLMRNLATYLESQ